MRKLLFVLAILLASSVFADEQNSIKRPPLKIIDGADTFFPWLYLITINGATYVNNNDGTATISCAMTNFLQLETGAYLLQEDGSKIILEL